MECQTLHIVLQLPGTGPDFLYLGIPQQTLQIHAGLQPANMSKASLEKLHYKMKAGSKFSLYAVEVLAFEITEYHLDSSYSE